MASTTCCMNTASCTTGWVNYTNEPSQAALERSSQDAYNVIRLTRSEAAVWTVDDVALSVNFKKNSYLFVQPAAKCRRTINVRSHRNATWRSGADAPSFISCVNVTSSLSSTPFSDFPIIASSSVWTFDSIFPFCSSLCGSAQLCISWASVVRCYLVNRLSEAVIHCELKYTVSAKRPPFSFFEQLCQNYPILINLVR